MLSYYIEIKNKIIYRKAQNFIKTKCKSILLYTLSAVAGCSEGIFSIDDNNDNP